MNRLLIILIVLLLPSSKTIAQSYWQGTGLTFNSHPRCMYYDSVTEKSYIAGGFQIVNGDSANVIIYDGDSFTIMPQAPIYYINAIIRYRDKLYAAGYSGGLASWDGNTWTLLESEGSFLNMKVYDDKLYVMGWQDTDRVNLPTSSVVVWNDTVWTDLLGLDSVFGGWGGLVTDIEFYKGRVYVGGNWYNPSRPDLMDLMMHDGSSWKPVGFFGGDGMGGVNRLLTWRDTLYVAGMFLESPIIPGNNIAAWDGQQWHRLQQGVRSNSTGGGGISAMTIYNDELWVGGMFYIVNGRFVATNYGNVAKWDGSQWCTMGSRSTGAINNFGRWKEELFAVGNIFVDNDMSKYRFIKWTGGNYTDTCNQNFTTTGVDDRAAIKETMTIFPNPANNKITIKYGSTFKKASCSIIDCTGRTIKVVDITPNAKEILIEDMAKGIYLLCVQFEDREIQFAKFAVE